MMESESDSSALTDLSSELSSLSRSPSPVFGYPSPQSSQERSSSASDSQQGSRKRRRDCDDAPPTKKRKSLEAQPRTTVHLDLRPTASSSEQTEHLHLLLKTLRKRRKIVVVAGAGISTSAGVPDFRSSNGLFNTLKSENKLKASGKHLFDASVYQTDDSTSSFHDMVSTLSKLVGGAKPTAFHEMLATLASEGRLMRLYTQNVDGIDTSLPPLATSVPLASKGPWPRTVQLHGSLENMVCSKCNVLKPFDATLFDGPLPPPCEVCLAHDEVRTEQAGKRSHGIGRLRPRMVLYNEHNPDEDAIGSVVMADLRSRPDAVIVVGTSMEIPGVKRIVREMCGVVRGRKDGTAIWINRGPPPISKDFEDCWDLIVAGDCDAVAHQANMRRWNDEGNDYKDCTESEAERAKDKDSGIQVLVDPSEAKKTLVTQCTTPKKKQNTPALLTPAESPRLKATKMPNPINFPLKLQDDGKILPKPCPKTATTKNKTSKPITKPKPKPNKSTASKNRTPTVRINTLLKVTKPQIVPPSTPQKPNPAVVIIQRTSPTGPERARRLLESLKSFGNDANRPTPMAIVPLHSARSNGPLSPAKSEESAVVKVEKVEVALRIETDVGRGREMGMEGRGRLKRMSEEVVSPVGGTPKGMGGLLN